MRNSLAENASTQRNDPTERDPLLSTNDGAADIGETPVLDPEFDDAMQPGPDVVQPSRKFIVEPVALLFCAGILSESSVISQYLYYRVGQRYNETLNLTRAFVCNATTLVNATEHGVTGWIQSEASQWILYRNIACSVIALVAMPVYASSSDYLGRKPALLFPCLGLTLDSLGLLLVVLLDMPLYWLVIFGGVGALGGGFGAFFAAIFAYLADTTTRKARPVRLAIIDGTLGLAGALIEPVIGWWIRLMGYTAPMIFSAAVTLANLLYVLLLVPEVRVQSARTLTPKRSGALGALLSPFVNIAGLFATSSRLAVILSLLLAAVGVLSACMLGISSVSSLYQMNYPFCLDSVFIGYMNAAKIISYQVGVVVGLGLLRRCLGVRPLGLAIVGMCSSILGALATGFARSTPMLYAALPMGMFAFLPIPMLRAYTSQIAPVNRQGALFSCISGLEVSGNLAGSVAFTIVYRGTQAWMPGFVFVTVACTGLLALALTCACAVINFCCPAKQTSWHQVHPAHG